MKTAAEQKFNSIVKEAFQKVLKPLGFKKKRFNFYRNLGTVGHIINIQKSVYGDKNHIRFTVNNSIFSATYWNAEYNYKNEEHPPEFPTEPVALFRKRLGDLIDGTDIWWEIDGNTDEEVLIEELREHVEQLLLPWFDSLGSEEDILALLRSPEYAEAHHTKFLMFAELGMKAEAKAAYEEIMKDEDANFYYQENMTEKAKAYGLI